MLIAIALAYFNLPAGQPLEHQLHLWSLQSRIELVLKSADVSPEARPALKGWYEPHAALCQLLEGSGLTFTIVEAQGIAIRPIAPHVHPTLAENCGKAPPMRADKPIRIDTWPAPMTLREGLAIIRWMTPSDAGGSLDIGYDVAKDALTPLAPVRPGDYTLQEALCGLLKGTGLRLDWLNSHAVMVAREQAESWACACTTDPLNTPPCIQVPVADWKR